MLSKFSVEVASYFQITVSTGQVTQGHGYVNWML